MYFQNFQEILLEPFGLYNDNFYFLLANFEDEYQYALLAFFKFAKDIPKNFQNNFMLKKFKNHAFNQNFYKFIYFDLLSK